jgi:hypothetical protein
MIQVPMGKHHAWQLTLSAIMFFNSVMELVGTRNVSKQYPSIINLMLQFIKVDKTLTLVAFFFLQYYDVRKEREGGPSVTKWSNRHMDRKLPWKCL